MGSLTLYQQLISDPVMAALAIQGVTSLSKFLFTPNTWKRMVNLVKKWTDKNGNQTLELIPEERKLKILKFLFSTVEDEEFDLKKQGYFFDLDNLIKNKNYIPIFNRITWDDLLIFQRLTQNYNKIISDHDLSIFFTNELSIESYIPITILYALNNDKELFRNNAEKRPITIEDFKSPGILNAKDKTLLETFESWMGMVKFNYKNDELVALFGKLESLNLIKLGFMPLFFISNVKTKRLSPFTLQNNIAFITNKGKQIFEILNSKE